MQLEHSHYARVDTDKPEPCPVLFRRSISRDEAGHAGAVYVCHGGEIDEDATMRTDVLKKQLQDRYRVIKIQRPMKADARPFVWSVDFALDQHGHGLLPSRGNPNSIKANLFVNPVLGNHADYR
jgi:hypothetical protein